MPVVKRLYFYTGFFSAMISMHLGPLYIVAYVSHVSAALTVTSWFSGARFYRPILTHIHIGLLVFKKNWQPYCHNHNHATCMWSPFICFWLFDTPLVVFQYRLWSEPPVTIFQSPLWHHTWVLESPLFRISTNGDSSNYIVSDSGVWATDVLQCTTV